MAHTITVMQETSTYQLIQYGTKLEYHSRWDRDHRSICDECNDAYHDELSQPEYQEIEDVC